MVSIMLHTDSRWLLGAESLLESIMPGRESPSVIQVLAHYAKCKYLQSKGVKKKSFMEAF